MTSYTPFLNVKDDTSGGRLKAARIAKHMYLIDLASITGLCTRTIGLVESNKQIASPPTLRLLSKALDVPISFLGCFEQLPETTLGNRITKARLYHGYTKREFALLLDVDVRTLFNWENDRFVPLDSHLNLLTGYIDILMKE